jgi:tRNA modification GTPase
VFSTDDTIVAIATPPGRGGIGVVRLSGPGAAAIAQRLTNRAAPFAARHATFATFEPPGHASPAADHVIVTYFAAPASYTGDDVVEISAHGSPVVLTAIVQAAIDGGARLAGPGEFTLRAFVNGRIDLAQAEAVADLVDAVTPLQVRAAFDQLSGTLTGRIAEIDGALFDLIARLEASVDFPEEGNHFVEPGALAAAIDSIRSRTARLLLDARRGRLIREGLQVAIVGAPNVGKSSLFNALVGASRAIVTPVPGTTRDLITETVDVCGLRVTLVDTAGYRQSDDPIELEGVARSKGAAAVADVILLVSDLSQPRAGATAEWLREAHARTDTTLVHVANKADLRAAWADPDAVRVSATTGAGLDELRRRIIETLDVDVRERPEITNVRHAALIERADVALERARTAALRDGQSLPEEFVLADLQDARAAFEEITGRRTPDDVLEHIFEHFCIGK